MIEQLAQALKKANVWYPEMEDQAVYVSVVGVVYPLNGKPAIILTNSNGESWVLSLERFAKVNYV